MPTHFKGRKETVRALNAFVNLIRASDSVAAHLGAQIEESGLTMGQFGVMEALLHLGPMCQHALAEKLLRSGGNVTPSSTISKNTDGCGASGKRTTGAL